MIDNSLDLTLTEEEQQLVELADEVCKNEIIPVRAELDEKEEFPTKILEKFKEAGLFNALFDAEYGGLGMPFAPLLLSEIVSKYCLGVGTTFLATKLGALPIEVGATEEQKQKWLPKLASGEKLAAFGLSEPNAGSDVPALSTVAVKKGDRYILNGTKQWISNAGQADYYTVFASTDKSKGPRGITCFFVEKGTPGFSFGKLENKLGIRCSHTRQLIFEDVEVPEENVIGLKPNKGFVHAMKTLTASRPCVAACAVGLAQGAYEEAVKYARQRKQFGKSIINFQVINHMLADMLVKIEGARLLTWKAGKYTIQNHPETPKFSAAAKYYASEIAMQVATDAVQIHGGYGFTKDYPVEKMFRDAKILAIYEGTSQIQKNEIGAYIIKEAQKLV
ncbi:MAG: acyl-CoA dehydrogenase [Candidatus Hydrogenedentota bacterium]|nr:MAG: acyl-CoA dehydrogenase [Candidatus Hydrogenedentota bacterium]